MEWVGSRGANRPLRDPDGGRSALALCDRTCHLFIRREKGPSGSILQTVNYPTPGSFRIIATQASSVPCFFFPSNLIIYLQRNATRMMQVPREISYFDKVSADEWKWKLIRRD